MQTSMASGCITRSTLVILHCGTCAIDVWPQSIAFFSKRYQVIAPEQMGHGHTADDPKRAFDYHAMAEDTVELLRQLKVEGAFLIGWSDGGIIALDIAMHHPDLVKKLAVSGANIHPLTDPMLVEWIGSHNPTWRRRISSGSRHPRSSSRAITT